MVYRRHPLDPAWSATRSNAPGQAVISSIFKQVALIKKQSMKIPTKISTYLNQQKVDHEFIPHRTVFTAYDLGQTLKVKLDEIAKTLLIKADKDYHLIVLRASDRLDLKKLQKLLAVKKVSIAREQDMAREMNVKPGALTPFGGAHKLPVVLERGLLKAKQALFGSGSFEHSIRMKVKDFVTTESPRLGVFGMKSGLKLQVKTGAPKKRPAKKLVVKKSSTRKTRR